MSIADLEDNFKKFKFIESSIYENKNPNNKMINSFISLIIKKAICKINIFLKDLKCEDKEVKKTGLFDREEWKKYWELWEKKSNKKHIAEIEYLYK
ncbi:hypothetical protein [Clostridium oceanicum]|uniref:Uncharacterized protein n=1 Tax=Clostridium oceanicum TaxID=1543 RepID=A0ABN1J8J2_9CLOT